MRTKDSKFPGRTVVILRKECAYLEVLHSTKATTEGAEYLCHRKQLRFSSGTPS